MMETLILYLSLDVYLLSIVCKNCDISCVFQYNTVQIGIVIFDKGALTPESREEVYW
jgi:hypothetical protein